MADEKNIKISFEKKNVFHKPMYIDALRIRQIFVNLLTNSIRFTPNGGSVDFIMEPVNETEKMLTYKFVIHDTGCGIGAEFLPHIYEPFSKEERVYDTDVSGQGLGLSIVKRIVDIMGGRIGTESEIGKGTTVTLHLDLATAEAQAEPAEKSVYGQDTFHGAHVLVCEDVALNALIMKKLLESKDIRTEVAENGKLGLELFGNSDEFEYDAILMDIRMPVMNGWEAAKAIRSLPRPDAATVPIIAVTANAFGDDVQLSLESGMNAHLSKPIEPNELFHTLAQLINRGETKS